MTTLGWHLVRFTITAQSPLSCGAGEGFLADNAISRDARGLPMIPGSTLQGLLRRDYAGGDVDDLFGCAVGKDIRSGRIICGNGVVHNADNQAVMPVPNQLQAPVPLKRDHVRLDHRHGAEKTGKFDRAAVPKGTRFSFEWLLFGAEADKQLLANALAPLQAPWLRIGSSGARGYGKISLDSVHHGYFPADKAQVFSKLRAMPLSNVDGLDALTLPAPVDRLTLTLELTPVNPWRVGQDGVPHGDDGNVRLTPLREAEIVWNGNETVWREPTVGETTGYVLPGSAVRGAVAHRTLFHWNRLNQRWACAGQMAKYAARAEELHLLLGTARDGVADAEGGQASALLFDDAVVQVANVTAVTHVKIDRFSGGAFPKALFTEEILETDPLTLSIFVRDNVAMDASARQALLEALNDLCSGRLALGAKSMGFFTGKLTISNPKYSEWDTAWQARRGAAQ